MDVFDEVGEELRADQLRGLLVRYGVVVAALMLLSLLAVGGWEAWQWRQGRRAEASAVRYAAAAQLADSAAIADHARALAGFDAVIGDGTTGFRTLARLRAAALRAASGDGAGADAQWNAVAADRGADRLLRDLAVLLWAQHNVAAGDAAAVAARLEPLRAPANPYHGLADETLALLDLRTGKVAEARDVLRGLRADPGAPDGVRERATVLLAGIDQ